MAEKENNQTNIHSLDKGDKKPKDAKKTGNIRPFTIGSIIILSLIVITFIGGPLIGGAAGSSRLVFGYWGKKPIELKMDNYFARQVDAYANYYRDQQYTTDDPFMQEYLAYQQAYQVYRSAFDVTVIHAAYMDMADNAGYHATEEKINKEILNSGIYASPVDGKFDEQRYLNSSNATRKSNYNLVEESLKQMAVRQTLLDPQVPVSQGELDFIKSMASPERKIRYVNFAFSDYPAGRVMEFAGENPKLFEKIDLSRITIRDNEALVLDIHSQLKANPLIFDELARTHSVDNYASRGGAMGLSAYYELRNQFDNLDDLDSIMGLAQDAISEIVVNADGWYIYRVNRAAQKPDGNNPQDVDDIRNYMIQYEKGRLEDYFVDRALEFTGAVSTSYNGNFTEAARRSGLTSHETEFFPLIYGNINFNFYGYYTMPLFTGITVSDGDTSLQHAHMDRNFLSVLSRMTMDSPISEPLILDGDGGVAVLQLLEEREASEETLGAIQSAYPQALADWKSGLFESYVAVSDKLKDNFNKTFGKIVSVPQR